MVAHSQNLNKNSIHNNLNQTMKNQIKSSVRSYSLLILGAFLMLAQAACKKEYLKNLATVTAELKSKSSLESSNGLIALKSLVTIVGHVTDDGGTPVVERGICYTSFESNNDKAHSEPTVNNSKLEHPTVGIGSFSMTINPGNASATYVVRAYAITKAGVAYGKAITFKTAAIVEKEVIKKVEKEVVKKIVTKQPTVKIVERSPKFQGGLSFDVNVDKDMSSWPLKSMKVEVYEVKKESSSTNYQKLYTDIKNYQKIELENKFDFLEKDIVNLPNGITIKPKTSYRIDVLVINADGVSRNITTVIKTDAD